MILLAPEAYRPLREMAARYHASADAAAVIADVDEVLDRRRPRRRAQPRSRTRRRAVDGERRGAVAGGRPAGAVTPGSAVDALELDRLDVRGGELVALRGPSGAGKTTALRVLAGLQPAARRDRVGSARSGPALSAAAAGAAARPHRRAT